MMTEREQVRPLAPAADRLRSDDDEAALHIKKIHSTRCIKCCGCATALILIIAVLSIILFFTVFRMKDPTIKLNNITVTHLELLNGTIPKPGVNMSLIADVSVKNPNVVSFKYGNTSTSVSYHGTIVGEARGPPGKTKARRTMRMNITVDVITDLLISNPNLSPDIASGLLNMSTHSRIGGRVSILKIIKKYVTVKMNCTISVNITSQEIQDHKCKRKVNL